MASEPTPRQVLYALVSAGFLVVVAILVVGAVGLVPTWWTVTMGLAVSGAGIWISLNWKRTAPVLAMAIGLFVVWLVGTLLLFR